MSYLVNPFSHFFPEGKNILWGYTKSNHFLIFFFFQKEKKKKGNQSAQSSKKKNTACISDRIIFKKQFSFGVFNGGSFVKRVFGRRGGVVVYFSIRWAFFFVVFLHCTGCPFCVTFILLDG